MLLILFFPFFPSSLGARSRPGRGPVAARYRARHRARFFVYRLKLGVISDY
jgi:hypothetical protein